MPNNLNTSGYSPRRKGLHLLSSMELLGCNIPVKKHI